MTLSRLTNPVSAGQSCENDYQAQLVADKNAMTKNLHKFWGGRYTLFSKYDQGIQLTAELWYSVTPEALAKFIANFISACVPATAILEVFCGGGGNTIQFAKCFDQVVALDYNYVNVRCTENNCRVYNVTNQTVLQADWLDARDGTLQKELQPYNFLAVFGSPPWGGTGYGKQKTFDLLAMQPMGLDELLRTMKVVSSNIVLMLPKNSDLVQISNVTRQIYGDESLCRIINVSVGGYPKAILACWGDAFSQYDEAENGSCEN